MSTQTIELLLEEPAGVERNRWPVTRGVPFPEDVLHDTAHLRLLDAAGQEVPLQAQVLTTWPNGSLRWVLLHFQADLRPQAVARYTLEYGQEVRRAEVASPVRVTEDGGSITVDTGPLQATFPVRDGWTLPRQVWFEGRPMLAPEGQGGVVLVDSAGRTLSTEFGRVTGVTIEENGPLRAVVHISGDHRTAEGERLLRYEVRLYAYAGLPWLELEYTFVNDADALYTEVRRIGFDINLPAAGGGAGLCGAYKDLYEDANPFSTYLAAAPRTGRFDLSSGASIYNSRGENVEPAWARELSHKVAHGWLDASDAQGGVTVAIKRMGQLYPKQMVFTGSAIQVDIWPAKAGTLRLHQGMARTHRILLAFHQGTGREAEVNKLGTCYELDVWPWPTGWYVESVAFGPVLAYQPMKYPRIEIALRDYFYRWQRTARTSGFLDYGDQYSGWGGTVQMANNYIDVAHALALQYARVGERAYYEELEATAWQIMDVDVVHHTTGDPVELGGSRHLGEDHVQHNCEGIEGVTVAPSQMWTEGLLEYYYLSGHPRALEIARGIGECFLRMLERGWGLFPYPVAWHGSRDSTWPLIGLLALYEATGEERWMEGCRRIVDNLLATQHEDGAWGMTLGWHRALSALHLGITLTGLSLYHQRSGDERVRESLIRVADALLDHASYPDGGLKYVTAPGHRRDYYSGVEIESLGYVWELTGDIRYLEAGWLGHRYTLGAWGPGVVATSSKAVPLASPWRGNLRYMFWADKAGLLTDLSV